MKFFHLSDLHLGLKLMNHDLFSDQSHILNQIVELAKTHRPDAVVIAGDIYDKAVPPAEAVELFDTFLTALTEALPGITLMLISGNHDSAPRVNCFRSILSRQKLHMIGTPPQKEGEFIEKVTLKDSHGLVNFYLLPFVKPSMVKAITGVDENGNNLSYNEALGKLLDRETISPGERNVLVSHQFYLPAGKDAGEVERMDSEIRTVGNIDQVSSGLLLPFDYAALGHIHKPMKVGDERFRYCGTPLACSVSEAGQQKGVILVELGRKEEGPEITVLPLHPLREVRILKGSLEEIVKQGCEDYVTVILTDKVDLDVIDMQERIRLVFPHLLEIRRETVRSADYSGKITGGEQLDPFELCCAFLKNPDQAEQEILKDVINTVWRAD